MTILEKARKLVRSGMPSKDVNAFLSIIHGKLNKSPWELELLLVEAGCSPSQAATTVEEWQCQLAD